MKREKIIIIVLAVVSLLVLGYGIFFLLNGNGKEETLKEDKWLEKKYSFSNSDEALKEIQRHYPNSRKEDNINLGEDCWLFTSKNSSELYMYCKGNEMIQTVIMDSNENGQDIPKEGKKPKGIEE